MCGELLLSKSLGLLNLKVFLLFWYKLGGECSPALKMQWEEFVLGTWGQKKLETTKEESQLPFS